MKKKKKVRRRIKWKVIFKIFFLVFLFFLSFFFIQNIRTKHILILGTHYVSDHEVIMAVGYKEYPKLFSLKKEEIERRVKSLAMVDDVVVHRNLFGQLTLDIKEATPLFYNRNTNKLVLDNKKEVDASYSGLPILINYVPNNHFEKLIEKLKLISENVRRLISEIEYQPWKSNDVMIDETRFFLRMNDGNSVYVNLLHLDKLNNYLEIFSSLEGKKGILYLDSSSDKISFSEYKEVEKNEDKLPENPE